MTWQHASRDIECLLSEGILTVKLNRAARMNAFTVTMAEELIDAFTSASEDDEVRAIVLTGEGKAFCAGMDLEGEGQANVFGLNEALRPTLQDLDDRLDDPEIVKGVRDTGGRVVLAMFECKKPIIAAINGVAVGVAGQVKPSEAGAMDVSGRLLAAEVELDAWLEGAVPQAVYHEIPRFPPVTRDMALVAPEGLAHGRVVEVLQSAEEALLQSVALFDVFVDPTGERVPSGSKSLGYSLTYRASDRTLTADEVHAAHGRLKQRVTAELGVLARE
jgi:hypothetical protein